MHRAHTFWRAPCCMHWLFASTKSYLLLQDTKKQKSKHKKDRRKHDSSTGGLVATGVMAGAVACSSRCMGTPEAAHGASASELSAAAPFCSRNMQMHLEQGMLVDSLCA